MNRSGFRRRNADPAFRSQKTRAERLQTIGLCLASKRPSSVAPYRSQAPVQQVLRSSAGILNQHPGISPQKPQLDGTTPSETPRSSAVFEAPPAQRAHERSALATPPERNRSDQQAQPPSARFLDPARSRSLGSGLAYVKVRVAGAGERGVRLGLWPNPRLSPQAAPSARGIRIDLAGADRDHALLFRHRHPPFRRQSRSASMRPAPSSRHRRGLALRAPFPSGPTAADRSRLRKRSRPLNPGPEG